jgi:hypothetical protein
LNEDQLSIYQGNFVDAKSYEVDKSELRMKFQDASSFSYQQGERPPQFRDSPLEYSLSYKGQTIKHRPIIIHTKSLILMKTLVISGKEPPNYLELCIHQLKSSKGLRYIVDA